MVQAVENWAVVTGTVRGVRELREGLTELTLEVARADDVPGFPNLLARAAGAALAVRLKTGSVERAGVRVGDAVSVRAQRAGPRSVVGRPDSLSVL